MKNRFRGFAPILLLFLITNALFIAGRNTLEKWNADQQVLIIGNSLLFAITLVSFLLSTRGMRHPNAYAFVRYVYGSVMVKLFVCMIAAFVYISMNKANLNKPALFTCMGLYLVYTFTEVAVLMKLMKRMKNG